MTEKGKLIVISAPAGCGKDTIVEALFAKYESEFNLYYSVSATTREMREGEVNGKHYFFISMEEFKNALVKGEFLEYAEYCGNYYGTRRKTLEDAMNECKNIILKIEGKGAVNVRRMFPESVLIFILPPSMEELQNRLEKRATEDEETIRKRLEKAEYEMANKENYDFCVVNDDLQTAVEEVAEIIKKAISAKVI